QARDESQDDLQSSTGCQAYQLQVTAGGNDSAVEPRQTVVMIGLGVRDTPTVVVHTKGHLLAVLVNGNGAGCGNGVPHHVGDSFADHPGENLLLYQGQPGECLWTVKCHPGCGECGVSLAELFGKIRVL